MVRLPIEQVSSERQRGTMRRLQLGPETIDVLSYRHAFHAGNFADVIKHIVLIEILSHLCRKDTSFDYIDTHGGAGLFALDAAETARLQEYKSGFVRLMGRDEPELIPYLSAVRSVNPPAALENYPGSPLIAAQWLRPQDRGWVCELHPADHQALQKCMQPYPRVSVSCEDGFAALNARLPPRSRRAAVLIDPPYEIKTDYDRVVDVLIAAHNKFATGIYALWYPVVDRARIERMEQRLINSGIRDIQRVELGVAPDTTAHGMTASGMIVINPPWTLLDTMRPLLPVLAQCLAGELGHSRCDVLVDE